MEARVETVTNAEEDEDPLKPGAAARPQCVLVIYGVIEAIERGTAGDLAPDMETPHTAQSVVNGLRARGYPALLAPVRSGRELKALLKRYDPQETLVFNLCESLGGTSSGEILVPLILEKYGFAYTGAPSRNLAACLNKHHAKNLLREQNIPSAPFQIFQDEKDAPHISFPAIVKPVAEDCSLGISADSVVHDVKALRQQVKYVLSTYKQLALVEEFLSGREFSVSVWGNRVVRILSICETDYSTCPNPTQRIQTFSEKWSREYFPSIDPAPITLDLRAQICKTATAAYRALGCRDYARVDLREQDGRVYVLEVNPNPCLAEDGGFARAARTAGYDYAAMVDFMSRQAWQRVWQRTRVKHGYLIPNLRNA